MYCDAKLGPDYDQTSSSGLNIYCVTSEILKIPNKFSGDGLVGG